MVKTKKLTRIIELEAMFERYRDIPQKVIIKEDILLLGISFTEPASKVSEG